MDLLTTPMKYKFNSLIGNWNEEKQLEEHKFLFNFYLSLLWNLIQNKDLLFNELSLLKLNRMKDYLKKKD